MRAIGIVAMDEGRGIGHLGNLPWPAHALDKLYWKTLALTCGQLVLGSAQALRKPPRLGIPNYTLTSCPEKRAALTAGGYRVLNSLADLEALEGSVAILGGEQIYRDMLGRFDALAVTRVPGRYPADRHFPAEPASVAGLELEHATLAGAEGEDAWRFEWWTRR